MKFQQYLSPVAFPVSVTSLLADKRIAATTTTTATTTANYKLQTTTTTTTRFYNRLKNQDGFRTYYMVVPFCYISRVDSNLPLHDQSAQTKVRIFYLNYVKNFLITSNSNFSKYINKLEYILH